MQNHFSEDWNPQILRSLKSLLSFPNVENISDVPTFLEEIPDARIETFETRELNHLPGEAEAGDLLTPIFLVQVFCFNKSSQTLKGQTSPKLPQKNHGGDLGSSQVAESHCETLESQNGSSLGWGDAAWFIML